MKRIKLGRTSVETSFLGFGCVQLTAHHSVKDAVNTLERAYDFGITHFDVARSYGFGRCEGILSRFLKNKRGRVTVTTKFGIALPSGFLGNQKLISYAKKILKPFPGILQRAKNHGAAMVKCGNYNAKDMMISLEKSLRELQTDFIDIFLLHEATLSDMTNEALIFALEQQIAKGKIRCFGIASDFEKLDNKLNSIPSSYCILQFNDNILNRNIQQTAQCNNQAIITHSLFKPFEPLSKAIVKNPEITEKFSAKMNIDLNNPAIINSLLLHYAAYVNPNGIVLFSSKNTDHIKKNIQIVNSFRCDDHQLSQFLEFSKEIFFHYFCEKTV